MSDVALTHGVDVRGADVVVRVAVRNVIGQRVNDPVTHGYPALQGRSK